MCHFDTTNRGQLSPAAMSGAPASVPGQPKEAKDLSIHGGAEKELCELILTFLIDAKLLDDCIGETKKIGTRHGFLVRFDLRLDPIKVRAPHISR
jgi:hypothetical protein